MLSEFCSQERRMDRDRGGRGKGKMLNAENLHVPGQAKMLSLGQEMSGEFGVGHGWTARMDVDSE